MRAVAAELTSLRACVRACLPLADCGDGGKNAAARAH